MNQPVIYAVVAMACYGLGDFIYKQTATAGIRSDHFLMAQAWFFCPLVIIYAFATHTLVLDPAALWGSLAGAFVFIGFYNFSRSLAAGSVSTTASIFRLNFIVTVVLVIALLGEPLTLRKIAGLALALVATWLLVGAAGSATAHPTTRGAARFSKLLRRRFHSAHRISFIPSAYGTAPFRKRLRSPRRPCSCRWRRSSSILRTANCDRSR